MSVCRHLLLLFAAVMLVSCAPPSPTPVPAVLPADLDEVLLRRLESAGGAYESLQGLAKVQVQSGGENFSSSQVLLAQRPDHLRAEALSPFGNPVLVAVADGNDLSVLLPTEGRFLRGAATYRNLVRFTRLPVQLPDLVGMLLYNIPVIPYHQALAEAGGEGGDGGYRLTLRGAEGVRQEIEFDRLLRLVQSSYWHADDLVLRVGYGKFEAQSGFPRTMFLTMPGQRTDASIAFSEVKVNVPLPPERFRLEPPPGYAVEPLR